MTKLPRSHMESENPKKTEDSNMVRYAEDELRRAGMFDADADYGGAIGHAVMKLVRTHAAEHHSGFSHAQTVRIFARVVDFKPLGPLTDDPAEWMEVDTGKMWQSRRDPSAFSTDGGKTCYSVDDPLRTAHATKARR